MKSLCIFFFFGVLGTLVAHPAVSDELRPGYLELRQTTPDTYSLLFKIPSRGDALRLGIYVNLPEGAHDVAAPRSTFNGGAYIERRSIRRDGGLTGHTIAIEGLSATSTDVLVRIEALGGVHADGTTFADEHSVRHSGHSRHIGNRHHISAPWHRAYPAGLRPPSVRPCSAHPGSGLATRRRHRDSVHRCS